jgi:hypothetical protein
MTCERFNEHKWIITGDIYSLDESMVTNNDLLLQEKELIAKGAIMPRPGWKVTFMPGLQDMPEITYHQQKVPPPRLAWVTKDATNADIAFGKDRKFAAPKSSNAIVLETERMQDIHLLSRRIVEFDAYAKHITARMEATSKSAEPDLGTLVERQFFVEAMSLASAEVHRARNFETDLVSHLNENAKSVDQIFVFYVLPL